MTANHPLDTEQHNRAASPPPASPSGPAPVRAIAGEAVPTVGAPQWAEAAAGTSVREDGHRNLPTARRPVELEAVARRRAELQERAAAMTRDPGTAYRSAYAAVLLLVVGFCAAGAAFAVWVLLNR